MIRSYNQYQRLFVPLPLPLVAYLFVAAAIERYKVLIELRFFFCLRCRLFCFCFMVVMQSPNFLSVCNVCVSRTFFLIVSLVCRPVVMCVRDSVCIFSNI